MKLELWLNCHSSFYALFKVAKNYIYKAENFVEGVADELVR